MNRNIESVLHIFNGVMQIKIILEFENELFVIIHSEGTLVEIFHLKKIWFTPL